LQIGFLYGVARIDAQERYFFADDPYLHALGLEPRELIGSDWKAAIHPSELCSAIKAHQEMQAFGIAEFDGRLLSGPEPTLLRRFLLIEDCTQDRVPSGHFCFIRSPFSSGSNRIANREGEEIFRLALDGSFVASALVDPNDGFKRANRALCDMLGYTDLELLGKRFSDFTLPQSFEKTVALATFILSGALSSYQLKSQVLRRDSEVFSAKLVVRLIRDADSTPLYAIGLLRPVPEAGNSMAALRVTSEPRQIQDLPRSIADLYEAIAEQGWEGIFLIDPVSKNVLEATRPSLQLLGFNHSEISRLTLYELIAVDRNVIDSDARQVVEGQRHWIGERLFRRKDGSTINLEVTGNVAYFRGNSVLRLVVRDIFEPRRSEELFRHAVKMEALGRFAGGIAHDFNNLLVGVLGNSTLLETKLKDNETLRQIAGRITDSAARAREVTGQLLSFGRSQMLPTEVVDINEVLKGAETLLRGIIGEDIELVFNLHPTAKPVLANPGQITRVLLNLAANSRDALPFGGRLEIGTDSLLVDSARLPRFPGLVGGEYVVLSVRDTGCGIDAQVLPHIFEPFFTTKGVAVGTGLGLSTVYGIVKQSRK
jgi:PAS domain S-box-containing protein